MKQYKAEVLGYNKLAIYQAGKQPRKNEQSIEALKANAKRHHISQPPVSDTAWREAAKLYATARFVKR